MPWFIYIWNLFTISLKSPTVFTKLSVLADMLSIVAACSSIEAANSSVDADVYCVTEAIISIDIIAPSLSLSMVSKPLLNSLMALMAFIVVE